MKREKKASVKTGTTAWKIRIDNEDLQLLKQVAEKIAGQNGGMIPKPSITAMIQKAVKKYITEALEYYEDNPKEARQRFVGRESGQRIH